LTSFRFELAPELAQELVQELAWELELEPGLATEQELVVEGLLGILFGCASSNKPFCPQTIRFANYHNQHCSRRRGKSSEAALVGMSEVVVLGQVAAVSAGILYCMCCSNTPFWKQTNPFANC
jgi:hypothetical protein